MGITIDKTISELEILKKNTFSYMTANQAFTTAIDTMRKYKKIQEIVANTDNNGLIGRQVREVIEDGNDD